MQRWHMTAGLAVGVVAAALVAPRLSGFLTAPPPADPTPRPVDPAPPLPPPPSAAERGHLVVEARLDRAAVLAGEPNERFLVVTVSAPADIGASFRRPVDLAVVMDTSGSMTARGKIDYAKRAAKLLAGSMEPGDVYALVTFSDDARTIIPATSMGEAASIEHAIDRIYEGGGTNVYAGLQRGAEEIRRDLGDGNVGRIVLLSDGNANVGVTDPDALARYAAELTAQGISVSAVGLGLDYNEDLLAKIADIGGGTYDFVDDPRQLEAVFADELERSAAMVARGTEVTVRLPAGVQGLELIGWDATATGDGWRVRVGDIYAGQSRKITARVRITGDTDGPMTVADVSADWFDLVDNDAGHKTANAGAVVTRDAGVVASSVDKDTSAQALRAYGNWYLDRSTRAYQSGDRHEAKRLVAEGEELLRTNARQLAAPALAADADKLGQQSAVYDAYAPESDEGKRAVKQAKEDFRAIAR